MTSDGNSVIAAVLGIAATAMVVAALFAGPQLVANDVAVQRLADAYGVTLLD